jgi:hypothetical protein
LGQTSFDFQFLKDYRAHPFCHYLLRILSATAEGCVKRR